MQAGGVGKVLGLEPELRDLANGLDLDVLEAEEVEVLALLQPCIPSYTGLLESGLSPEWCGLCVWAR